MYVKLEKNPDGSHTFQSGGSLENGWAVVPSDMPLPDSFPYVDITTEPVTRPAIDDGPAVTRLEVVAMTARDVPEQTPPEPKPDRYDELAAAYREGVQSA